MKKNNVIKIIVIAALVVVLILIFTIKPGKSVPEQVEDPNPEEVYEEVLPDDIPVTHENDPEEYIEPQDERILSDENLSNDNYEWTETVIAYEEDEKVRFVNVNIKKKNSNNAATADIVVNYNDMSATCTVSYSIDNMIDTISFNANENGLVMNSAKSDTELIKEDMRADYDKIISDVIYKTFH